MNDIMSINSRPGNKVIFAFPYNGNDPEIKLAKKHLTEGEKYTIKTIKVYGYHTDIVLKEIPNIIFNSVQFKNVRKRT